MPFLSSVDFFLNQLFGKIISGILSECQRVWILIRPDVLSRLIWVQTVCQGYQQTTLAGKELNPAGTSSYLQKNEKKKIKRNNKCTFVFAIIYQSMYILGVLTGMAFKGHSSQHPQDMLLCKACEMFSFIHLVIMLSWSIEYIKRLKKNLLLRYLKILTCQCRTLITFASSLDSAQVLPNDLVSNGSIL